MKTLSIPSLLLISTIFGIVTPMNNVINILLVDRDGDINNSSITLDKILEFINNGNIVKPGLPHPTTTTTTTTALPITSTSTTTSTTSTTGTTTPTSTIGTTTPTTTKPPCMTKPVSKTTTTTSTTGTTTSTSTIGTTTPPTTKPVSTTTTASTSTTTTASTSTTTTASTSTAPPLPPCVDSTKATWDSYTQSWFCECLVGFAGDPLEVCGTDSDLDGWPDYHLNCSLITCFPDNCPLIPNSGQEDCDKDLIGDACDLSPGFCQGSPCDSSSINDSTSTSSSACQLDTDIDGIPDDYDNCPYLFNPSQKDQDGDGLGDICDNCPKVANKDQKDENRNFVGDACDNSTSKSPDTDGDGIADEIDNCVTVSNPNQLDSDFDGLGDVCDDDDDNDGILDVVDNCKFCYNPFQLDSDNNGLGDACEKGDFDCDCLQPPCRIDPCPQNNQISRVNFNEFITVALDPITSGQNDPNWVINDGGKEIVQTLNSDPGLAIGIDTFEGVDYEGTVFVNTRTDDDYIGFVFGYKDSSNFYVVSWKKNDQTSFWPAMTSVKPSAKARITLKAIKSNTGPGPHLKDALWDYRSFTGQSKVLYSTINMGWQYLTSYRWELSHRPSSGHIQFKIYEGGSLIVDSGTITDFTHKGGRLGVYCFSQEKIHWSKLSYKCNEDSIMTRNIKIQDDGTYNVVKKQSLKPWTMLDKKVKTSVVEPGYNSTKHA